jgi:uncharacterized protein
LPWIVPGGLASWLAAIYCSIGFLSRWFVCGAVILLPVLHVRSAEVLPPKPERYFNDYAGVVSRGTAEQLNQTLEQFERTSSSQILVVIYPKMQSDSSVEDYTVRVAQSWAVGQKSKNNGAVLFVFIQSRQLYLQVGYGLEGAIPDATAKNIIEQVIKPRFKAGDFDGGLTAGVQAILQAARGEYLGTGRTVADQGRGRPHGGIPFLLLLVVVLVLMAAARRSQGTVYRRSGRSAWTGWPGGWGGGGWSGGGGGGGWSGGGGGGGFSGGGGSFGGGGAGGNW